MKRVFEEGMNFFAGDSDKKVRLRRHALRFTWAETVKNYMVLYQNLLKS
jgi:hypothetical protein